MEENKLTQWLRSRLGYQVAIAVLLGIFVGLFFGPLCSILKPLATAYTMLLQMVVLPYISFSLIHGLGSIPKETGKKIFRCAWPHFLGIWIVVFEILFLVATLIPNPPLTLVQIKPPLGSSQSIFSAELLQYLVPENPFYDLANNILPAIAIFGLIVGCALMQIENKEPLSGFLERMTKVIEKILVWLAIISPIGVFAHISVALGTVSFENLYKLGFFVLCFVLFSVFITFIVIPLILTSLTPLKYREILKAYASICIIPFTTGLATIALPFLMDYLRKYEFGQKNQDPKFRGTAETLLPVAYSFGQIGSSVILFFILFLSFYYRLPFTGTQKFMLSFLTVPLSIGSGSNAVNAVSFLVDQFHFPKEALELFVDTAAITTNFIALMSVAGIFALLILSIHAYYGILEVQWKKMAVRLGSLLVAFVLLLVILKPMVRIQDNYQDLFLNLQISDVIENPVQTSMLGSSSEGVARNPNEGTLSQILKTGVLKLGYNPTDIPYCYWNNKHELAGLDIAYAYQLAKDLDCKIEFIPLDFDQLGEELERGDYDIGMCAVMMTEERIALMNFSQPYYEEDNVLVVPIGKKNEYLNLAQVIAKKDLRLGIRGAFASVARHHFPNAIAISTANSEPLLKGEVDALLWTHISGFIWCLSNPGYVVIDYHGEIGWEYFGFPVAQRSEKLTSFLNNWLLIKRLSGFEKQMQEYWMEGVSPKQKKPRWSILRNVLHVGE